MLKKIVYLIVLSLVALGVFYPNVEVIASPNMEFSNGDWELCYYSGWFIFQKETCNIFPEGNYILTFNGNTWTLNMQWSQDINFKAKLVRIKQKSLLGTLEVFASNLSYTSEPIIYGKQYCEYGSMGSTIDCNLWANKYISIVSNSNVVYTIFATEYLSSP
jgi:hypothetical protein